MTDRRRRLLWTCVSALALAAGPSFAQTLDVPSAYPTIQAAIDAAPDGATVQIAPGTYRERVRVGDVQRTLLVRGDPDDPSRVVIDGEGVEDTLRLVNVGSGVTFEGLTISGGTGYQGYGGGLFMATSFATFRRCVFTNNHAGLDGGGAMVLESGGLFQDCVFRDNTAQGYGGGVMVNVRATTVFERCTFADNRAGLRSGLPYGTGGGAHVNDSAVTFAGCTVQGNRATAAGGGLLIIGHWDVTGSDVTVQDCLVADNVADEAGTDPGEGAGIHVEDNARLTLARSVVRGNHGGTGGGVSVFRSTVTIDDSVIEGNTATERANGIGGYAGGLYVQSVNPVGPLRPPANVTLRRSVVRGNGAKHGAGVVASGDIAGGGSAAAFVVEDSIIADNQSSAEGGGVIAYYTNMVMRRTHLVRNRSVTSFGGGLATLWGSATTIDDTTIAGNEAAHLGGGIYASLGGSLEVVSSRLYGNRASSAAGLGGGAIAFADVAGPTPGPVTGRIAESVIADNEGGSALWEGNCDPVNTTTVTFERNAFANATPWILYRACGGSLDTVSALNGDARGSGNGTAAPDFVDFVAAPAEIVTGGTSVLSWVAPPATSLEIAPAPGAVAAPLGLTDVTPAATTTYTLSGPSVASAQVQVTVVCAALGVPIPRSPASGGVVSPGPTSVSWYPVAGATGYDVLLDAGDVAPTTVVAADTTATTAAVGTLPPNGTFSWRVVAKNPICDEPVLGAVARFATCGEAPCIFEDTFDDGDASDWTRIGRGDLSVVGGRLRLDPRRRLVAMAPAPAMTSGAVELDVLLDSGRRYLRLLFGYADKRNFNELIVKSKGQWKLQGRRNGRIVRVGRGRSAITLGERFGVQVETDGTSVRVTKDGAEVVTGAYPEPTTGAVGVGGVATVLSVDEVRITRGTGP